MRRMRVFIASAGKAQPLAEALYNAMTNTEQTEIWDVIPWWDKKSEVLRYGQTVIESLKDECRKADLAVTLLTADDYTIKNGKKMMEPRDNCIFEAGLFMGALGLDSKRSVLVTSVTEGSLPSDFKGIQVINFQSPTKSQFEDAKWRSETMSDVAKRLKEHVLKIVDPPKRPVLPVLSSEALFEREKPEWLGGQLKTYGAAGRAVVINTTQPAETKVTLARQVVKNMEAGVEYVYFFRADLDRVPIVTGLLQSLVLAAIMDEPTEPNQQERERFIRQNQEWVIESLTSIQPRLFIHFLPEKRAPLFFCVHNARDDQDAKCYLRDVDSKYFYLWAEGEKAFIVASDLMRLRKDPNDPAVFYSTDFFDLYGTEGIVLHRELEHSLDQFFGKRLARQLKPLCFPERGTAEWWVGKDRRMGTDRRKAGGVGSD